MNKLIPYQIFAKAAESLQRANWIFAKTMPGNPHYYTLRKDMNNDDFVALVETINKYGYKQFYKWRSYILLDINEYFYWTMGAPIQDTILINKKLRDGAPYDMIADQYDSLFKDQQSIDEDKKILSMIDYSAGQRILDIGCGTGLFVDYVMPEKYIGIDPSEKMLSRFVYKHPEYANKLIHTGFESFYMKEPFDMVIALYGVASYINIQYLAKIMDVLALAGKYFLMFYKPGYFPITYQKTRHVIKHNIFNESLLSIKGYEKIEFGNYIIIRGSKWQ